MAVIISFPAGPDRSWLDYKRAFVEMLLSLGDLSAENISMADAALDRLRPLHDELIKPIIIDVPDPAGLAQGCQQLLDSVRIVTAEALDRRRTSIMIAMVGREIDSQ